MTKETHNSDKLKSDVKKLKSLLIPLTVAQVIYMLVTFTNPQLWMKLDFDYNLNWIIGIVHIAVVATFIWYDWKKMPDNESQKMKNTFLILLLGIIGMWLWLPNKTEIDKLK